MWDYKVVAGRYSLDGADVIVENPLGKGTLQRILDHYGNEGFELVSTHYDGINREVVLLMKRARGVVPGAVPMMAAPAAMGVGGYPAPAHVAAAPAAPAARGAPAPAPGAPGARPRRSARDLDKLARDD